MRNLQPKLNGNTENPGISTHPHLHLSHDDAPQKLGSQLGKRAFLGCNVFQPETMMRQWPFAFDFCHLELHLFRIVRCPSKREYNQSQDQNWNTTWSLFLPKNN
ncbi:hypothetical protein AA313_de0209362 [Arthrobotrys entomopaga]|nr:hypothetical protein AA313_de0209362 [Arthrobotrys entomopaga]